MRACFSVLTVLRLWLLVLLLLAPPRAAGIAAIILDGCDRRAAKQRLCGAVGSALAPVMPEMLEHIDGCPATDCRECDDGSRSLPCDYRPPRSYRCTAVQPVVTSAQEVFVCLCTAAFGARLIGIDRMVHTSTQHAHTTHTHTH
jgi:hypothetical protein